MIKHESDKIFGVFAEFREPEDLMLAAKKARALGYTKLEAFSPYPVEGLGIILGHKPDKMAIIALVGGIIGGMGGFFMQYYANVFDYPLNIGGRPDNSWPSFIPITFELTILGAALCAGIGMLLLNRFPMPHYPMFNAHEFMRASKDGFFLCIRATDPRFNSEKARAFLATLNPRSHGEIYDEA